MIILNKSGISPNFDEASNKFLLYSRCSGYELATGSFDENGDFSHFLCTSAGELISVLPEEIDGWLRLDRKPSLVMTQ